MNDLRKNFLRDTMDAVPAPRVLAVAVEHPNEAVEVIINYEMLDEKILWYQVEYDDNFRLRRNPDVRVVGYMLV